MFEKLIQQLILKYLGDYIENLDENNLSLALWSGTLSLENIHLKSKVIDDMQLPFKLTFGLINKLTVFISWKTNFSEPTEITIEGLNIVLSLVDTNNWEYIDYTSFNSKLEQLMKYSEKKYEKLVEAFNDIKADQQKGYTDTIFIKIVDNLQITFKDISLRIEEQNINPYYSMGIVLKEMKVTNTDKNWESHFIDRNVEKNEIIYKLLKINNFAFYLKVNEDVFVSKIETEEKKLEKISEISDLKNIKESSYLIEPFDLIVKMKQVNDSFENLPEEEKKEPLLSFYVELPKFNISCHKDQYECFFRILNYISKYQKFQKIYFDRRKFNYFKPRYAILDKEHQEIENVPNSILWFKFSINMILKTLKYYKGNKNIFNIPKKVLEEYKNQFIDLFTKYYKSIKEKPDFNFESDEEKYLFNKILISVDINILKSWTDKIIEQDFKQKKKEEKQQANSSYFSYFFGLGEADDENDLFTEEEKQKLNEILNSDNSTKVKNPEALLRDNVFIEYKLLEGNVKFSKNIFSKNMKMTEGFNVGYKDINFTLSKNDNMETFKINASLKTFYINMFTIVNQTINTIPITYRYLSSKEGSFKEMFLNNLENNEQMEHLITFKFSYTPLLEVNSTIDLNVKEFNLIYHQTFIQRLITFFFVKGNNEDLKNNVMEGYKSLRKETRAKISSNITKKNNIKINIEPRKIVIPINKYDIKNSKILVIDLGQVYMDTTKKDFIKKLNTDELEIYNKNYVVDLGKISFRYYYNTKDMLHKKNNFDILKDLNLIIRVSLLNKKKYSPHDYPLIKFVLSIDNFNLHLTEYLYNISIYLTDILSPVQEKDVWSQLIINKSDIAKNSTAMCKLLKKNWFNGVYENYLALLSGGYIYFYKNGEDEEYEGYFYLKDSEIKPTLENLIILISNYLGSIELKFPNEEKFKLWTRSLNERIEEMKFSYIDMTEEIVYEEKLKIIDPEEIIYSAEINFKTFNCFLYLNDDVTDMNNNQHIFSISINEMSLIYNGREYDSQIIISIFGMKVYDVNNEINDFRLMADSEDSINKEVKLFNMEIDIFEEKSPEYKNIQVAVDLNIGYLYLIWVPDTVRKLLFFLTHNTNMKNKVQKEITDPNEKLIEQKFIEPKIDNQFYPTCDKNKYIMYHIHVDFKKVDIIWVQPILKIFYHEIKFDESFMDYDMYIDHSTINGRLGNTQIYDLCEYPFVISDQKKFNPKNKVEVFGVKDDKNDNYNKGLISFNYDSYNKCCPFFKDNYSDIATVDINTVYFLYTQEQFLRFLNYFIDEFLGALAAPPEIKEEEIDLKHFDITQKINSSEKEEKNISTESNSVIENNILNQNKEVKENEEKKEIEKNKENNENKENKVIKEKDLTERDNMTFLKLDLKINSPQLILKARPNFNECFYVDLGQINLQAFYKKIYGKILDNPSEWRWLATYQMKLSKFGIVREDGFKILSQTNSIVNMHFTCTTKDDLLLKPNEIDMSFQFDIFFNELNLNLRQKDYIFLLKCNDLNIMYTDNKEKFYDYAKNKTENEKNKEKSNNNCINNELTKTVSSSETESKNNNCQSSFISDSTPNSSDNNNLNTNNNIDLSKYLSMLVIFFVNRVTINLYLDNEKNFSQLVLDELLINFQQKLDYSCIINFLISNIEIFNVIDENNHEILVSDFTQMINQIKDDDFESNDSKGRRSSSFHNMNDQNIINEDDIIETLKMSLENEDNIIINDTKRDSFICNQEIDLINTNQLKSTTKKIFQNTKQSRKGSFFKHKLVEISSFGLSVLHYIQKCEIINENIKNNMNKIQFNAEMIINTKREKIYNIKIENLKVLIRIDSLYLIYAFLVDGMPFYSPEEKDLPNLFEENEENLPGMRFDVEIKNPLICLLSDNLNNLKQELCCIEGKIKFIMFKEKIATFKRKIMKERKIHKSAIQKVKNSSNDSKIISQLQSQMNSIKYNTYKMKVMIDDISPFICKLEQILNNEKIYISNRKLTNAFNISYSDKTKIKYDYISKKFEDENKTLMKISKISVNMSFRDMILLMKVSSYFNFLQNQEEYKKCYDDLLYYTNAKKNYEIQKSLNEAKKLAKKKKKVKIKPNTVIIKRNKLKISDDNNENNKINSEKIEEQKEDKIDTNLNINIINTNSNIDNKDQDKNTDQNKEESEDDSSEVDNNEEYEEISSEDEEEFNNTTSDQFNDNKSENNDTINTSRTINSIKFFEKNEEREEMSEADLAQKSLESKYTLTIYKISEFDIVFIDNQKNSYLPFLHLKIPKLEYSCNALNTGYAYTSINFQISALIYNYVASIWEPLIEPSNMYLIQSYDPNNKGHLVNKYKFQVINLDNSPLNINISNLCITGLYSIILRWAESYKKMSEKVCSNNNIKINNEKNKNIDEEEILEKKMKISNHTLYNYTGRKLILDKNINSLYDEDFNTNNDEDDSYCDFFHLSDSKILVDNCRSYEVEFHDKKKYEEDYEINNNNIRQTSQDIQNINDEKNNTIKFNLLSCKIKRNENIIKIDKISTKKIHVKCREIESQLKNEKGKEKEKEKNKTKKKDTKNQTNDNEEGLSAYSYVVSKVVLNENKKSIYLFSPLSFKNKTEQIVDIKIDSPPLPTLKNIKIKTNEIYPVPFEYMNGYLLVKIGNSKRHKCKLIDFMILENFDKEIEFDGFYANFYYSNKGNNPYRIVQIKTNYILRNLLPFELQYSIKMSKDGKFSNYQTLQKGQKAHCNLVSRKNDLITDLKFLEFQTALPSILHNLSKKDELIQILKFQDKEKQEVDIICTTIKKGKITIILHPNGILLNHANEELSFYYGKRKAKDKENKEIPGKISYRGVSEKTGNIFLLKNDVDKIHLKYKNYISPPFSVDAIGTETIIKCEYSKKEKEKEFKKCRFSGKDEKNEKTLKEELKKEIEDNKNKYIEFVMKNTISLLNKDVDLFCSVIEFAPRFIVYNKLNYTLIISNNKNDELLIIRPEEKQQFNFFGYGENFEIMISIKDKSNNWAYSLPFTIGNNNLTTIQILNVEKTKRKFINITSKLYDIITVLIFTEATINNSKLRIANYSSKISMKVFQQNYQYNQLFIEPKSKSIFAWSAPDKPNIIRFNFGFGNLTSYPIMISHSTKYELKQEHLIVTKNNGKEKINEYPYEEKINVHNNFYYGQTIKLLISTDGVKFIIKIYDDERKTEQESETKKQEFEFEINIKKLGLSIIGDNTYTECNGKTFLSYNRNEICYMTFENVQLYYGVQNTDEKENKIIQLKCQFFEIDNQISPFTNFPVVVIPNYEEGKNKNNSPQFFNLVYSSENNLKENTFKILKLSFLIQSFSLSLESNLLSTIIHLVRNITTHLKTSFTNIHPLFLSNEENEKNNIVINGNYSFPPWLTASLDFSDESDNVFICHLETSPMEIIFSFISENKDKLFQDLLLNNPVLRKFVSLFSNIEKTNINLNKDIRYNISTKSSLLFSSILDTYRQYMLLQIMKLGMNIEILGNPVNLVKSLGTGVKDFFQKPAEGILMGPLEGVKGIYNGTKSLVQNTLGGALNTVSKITSGVSKEILIISQDENYINEREKNNMMNKPQNIVEGIGYGLSSMMSGIYYGITDLVRKPLEGAKKDNLKGFGKGILKGLGGLVSKPVSGVVDLVSKTTDGLKNTWSSEEVKIKQQRLPRAFYGKFKYIKNYDKIDAKVIYHMNKEISVFKKKMFNDYMGSIEYINQKGERNLLVFGATDFYLIGINRFELIIKLDYNSIKNVSIQSDLVVRIELNKKLNGKIHASIKLSDKHTRKTSNKILKMFRRVLDVDN